MPAFDEFPLNRPVAGQVTSSNAEGFLAAEGAARAP